MKPECDRVDRLSRYDGRHLQQDIGIPCKQVSRQGRQGVEDREKDEKGQLAEDNHAQ